jgi:hypothetical protein
MSVACMWLERASDPLILPSWNLGIMFENFFVHRKRRRSSILPCPTVFVSAQWLPYTRRSHRQTALRRRVKGAARTSSACSFWCAKRYESNLTQADECVEFERRNVPPPPFAAGPVLSYVSRAELLFVFLLTGHRPHSRKEAKLDTKTKLHQLNELAGTLPSPVNSSFALFRA